MGSILLASVALVPLVLLFAFIGCSLETSGLATTLRTVLGESSFEGIQSVQTTFTLKSNLALNTILKGPYTFEDLIEGEAVETSFSHHEDDTTTVTCTCTLMPTDVKSAPIVRSSTTDYSSSPYSDSDDVTFELRGDLIHGFVLNPALL